MPNFRMDPVGGNYDAEIVRYSKVCVRENLETIAAKGDISAGPCEQGRAVSPGAIGKTGHEVGTPSQTIAGVIVACLDVQSGYSTSGEAVFERQ